MNKYLVLGLFIAFVAWSGFMYHEGTGKEKAVCGQADATHDLHQANATIGAQQAVSVAVAQQQTATQGASNDYEQKKAAIDNAYAQPDSVREQGQASVPRASNVRPVPYPTSRPDAATPRQFVTKAYKLSPLECDENTEQLYGLQAWVRAQQAIKTPTPWGTVE